MKKTIKINDTFENKSKIYKVVEISRNIGVVIVEIYNKKGEYLSTRNISVKELLK